MTFNWKRYRNPLIVLIWFAVCFAIYAAKGIASVPLEAVAVMFVYLAVATPVRAVPGWMLLLLFGIGNVVVPWATVLLQFVLRAMTTRDAAFLSGVIAPTTEELMKMLPVLVLYAWKRPRLRAAFGAVDWMLCGLAAGMGASVWEDVLIRAEGFPSSAPDLFGVPLFAGYTVNSGAEFIGHAAATAFIALALGWTRYLKRLTAHPQATARPGLWAAFRASRAFAYSPAVLVLIWMIIDHAGNNLRNEQAWYWLAAKAFYQVGGRGRIAPYVFLVAVAVTLIFEFVLLRRMAAPSFKTPPSDGLLEGFRRAWRRTLRSRQIRYARSASSSLVADSNPGWSLPAFLKRTFAA